MIGQKIGHYRVDAKLGEGGMGVVYRAHDEHLKRDIALKVLAAVGLSDATARKRFRQEALALSQLNHPHICTVYEVGEFGGQAYIAMEHIPGVRHVSREPLKLPGIFRGERLCRKVERGLRRPLAPGRAAIRRNQRPQKISFIPSCIIRGPVTVSMRPKAGEL